MRIDCHNKNLLNTEIYLHDAEFSGFTYDYENNLILLEMKEHYRKKHFKLEYHNVFGFKMTSCDFWGECLRVDTVYAEDESRLTKEIANLREDSRESRMSNIAEPVEVVLSIISGDRLTVVCEYIEFEETSLGFI